MTDRNTIDYLKTFSKDVDKFSPQGRLINNLLRIAENNLSEDYDCLGEDSFTHNNKTRIQFWVDGRSSKIVVELVHYLNKYYNEYPKNIDITYGRTMRVMLTITI